MPLTNPPQYGPRHLYRSTYYYSTPNTAFSTVAWPNNTHRLIPFWVAGDGDEVFDRIAVECTTVGSPTTAAARLGIYNDDGTGYPGTLLLDAGTVTISSAAAFEITLGTPVTLIGNALYWLAGSLTGATTTAPTMRVIAGAQQLPPIGSSSGTDINPVGWGLTNGASNAFPSPFTAGATPQVSPRFLLRKQ